MKVKVRFYGLFKKYGEGVELDVPEGVKVSDLRSYLDQKLACGKDLLRECAFADDHQILDQEHKIQSAGTISILPPVCGG